ncbi:hypothetical protein JMJ77_0008023 [Colletotrichum scovillei]|uniref:Uncharacterized protein n=1 Tax=Colletotrichum scovillei TaxID=1209932 RepID=A0A9P7UG29_9PEZI|nr:hypothetical protein JMJ77_0008023 [Colletotrichum scovillei]KAG7075012.1 hypothetical protein JMJ76_0011476 [Colletotrichum scovillei]KAG7081995.1 hypothetical protein JMJ78_0004103 [Colletotrichum scovillei]
MPKLTLDGQSTWQQSLQGTGELLEIGLFQSTTQPHQNRSFVPRYPFHPFTDVPVHEYGTPVNGHDADRETD